MPKQIKEGDENVPRRSLRLQMKKKNSSQTPNEEKEVLFKETKMIQIHDMPAEMLSMIFSFVPTCSLTSVGRTCKRWLDILSRKWFRDNYWPRLNEILCADELISSGHLPATYLTNLATKIRTNWFERHWLRRDEIRCARALQYTGHLPEDFIKECDLYRARRRLRKDWSICQICQII